MCTREHMMPDGVDQLALLLSWLAPQQKHNAFPFQGDCSDGCVRECLPSLLGMGVRRMSTHRQHSIEQQHALVGPLQQQAETLWPVEKSMPPHTNICPWLMLHVMSHVLSCAKKGKCSCDEASLSKLNVLTSSEDLSFQCHA